MKFPKRRQDSDQASVASEGPSLPSGGHLLTNLIRDKERRREAADRIDSDEDVQEIQLPPVRARFGDDREVDMGNEDFVMLGEHLTAPLPMPTEEINGVDSTVATQRESRAAAAEVFALTPRFERPRPRPSAPRNRSATQETPLVGVSALTDTDAFAAAAAEGRIIEIDDDDDNFYIRHRWPAPKQIESDKISVASYFTDDQNMMDNISETSLSTMQDLTEERVEGTGRLNSPETMPFPSIDHLDAIQAPIAVEQAMPLPEFTHTGYYYYNGGSEASEVDELGSSSDGYSQSRSGREDTAMTEVMDDIATAKDSVPALTVVPIVEEVIAALDTEVAVDFSPAENQLDIKGAFDDIEMSEGNQVKVALDPASTEVCDYDPAGSEIIVHCREPYHWHPLTSQTSLIAEHPCEIREPEEYDIYFEAAAGPSRLCRVGALEEDDAEEGANGFAAKKRNLSGEIHISYSDEAVAEERVYLEERFYQWSRIEINPIVHHITDSPYIREAAPPSDDGISLDDDEEVMGELAMEAATVKDQGNSTCPVNIEHVCHLEFFPRLSPGSQRLTIHLQAARSQTPRSFSNSSISFESRSMDVSASTPSFSSNTSTSSRSSTSLSPITPIESTSVHLRPLSPSLATSRFASEFTSNTLTPGSTQWSAKTIQ